MSANALRWDSSQAASPNTDTGPEKACGFDSHESLLMRGRQILRDEIAALEKLHDSVSDSFSLIVQQIAACRGRVIVTGIGKAGIIGQKFSATLSSTGTPSHFLHPAEAVHGDLGGITAQDVVVLFSYSGETDEVNRLLPLIHSESTVAITKTEQSTLGSACRFVLPLGNHREACSLGLAPSTSTTLMLAMSDSLALVASEVRGFTARQFAGFHPGGSLGRKLGNVNDIMRPLNECRVASHTLTVRDVFVQISRPGRRTGAIMLVDDNGCLEGIFTDSDLARILERQQDESLDQPVADVMTRKFHTIQDGASVVQVVDKMREHKISELPVVSESGLPVGLVDVTDIMDLIGATDLKTTANDHESEEGHAGESTELRSFHSDAESKGRSAEQSPDVIPTGDPGVPRILSLIKYRKESQ